MEPVGLCPILVGRQLEMAALINLLREGGGVAIVSGEAGIGKTRLLRGFADKAPECGGTVVWGRPELVSETSPYSLLADLLENIQWLGHDTQQLHGLLTSSADRRDPPPARQIAARLRGLIADLGERPVVVLEHLNAADESSQAVIAHLARAAKDDGLLIVGAVRTEEEFSVGTARLLDVLYRDRLAVHLDLGPLPRGDVHTMLEAMWLRPPSDDELSALLELAEGVPFYVEELASSRGMGGSVPKGIAATVTIRLQSLNSEARRIAEAASLSIGAIDPQVLSEATRIEYDKVVECLMDGLHSGLLADRDGRLVYRHELIREAVAMSLPSIKRASLNRALAQAIEKVTPDGTRSSLALGHHYKQAGDHARAAHWLAVAGKRALQSGAVEDAVSLLMEAVSLKPDTAVAASATRDLAEACIRKNEYSKAVAHLEAAANAWITMDMRDDAAEALAEEAWLRALMRDSEAIAVIRRAGALAEKGAHHARVLFKEAQVTALLIDLVQAEKLFLDALAEASRESSDELIALCCIELAEIYSFNGQLPRAQQMAVQAESIVVDQGLDQLVGRSFGTQAWIESHLGNNLAALAKLDAARERLIEGLSSHHVVELEISRAWILWRMGQPEAADRAAMRIAIGRVGKGYGTVIGIWAAIERDDSATARHIADRWWDEVGRDLRSLPVEEMRVLPEAPEGGQYAQLADAMVAAFDEKPSSEDEDRARRYWELCDGGIQDVRLHSLVLYVRCLVARKRFREAQAVLEEARLPSDELHPYHRAFLLEAQSGIELGMGHDEAARDLLAAADEAFKSIENSSDRARVLTALAGLSDAESAKERLRRALELASSSGAVRYARRAEAGLRSLGVRPRAGRPRGSGRRVGLSAREEEVVALVATGATNAEIASRLFLSDRTVQDHLRRAGKRLGVSGRAGLAAWAAKQGLV